MINFNIYTENTYEQWEVDSEKISKTAQEIFNFYLKTPEIANHSCLKSYEFDTVSFDFLFCDSNKTHEINKEYREKDYPADIITFAIFADSEEKFIFDGEINLGEVIIALDKVKEEAGKKGVTPEHELLFLVSHGILHLLGFDHQTMEEYNFVVEQQNKALESLVIR